MEYESLEMMAKNERGSVKDRERVREFTNCVSTRERERERVIRYFLLNLEEFS